MSRRRQRQRDKRRQHAITSRNNLQTLLYDVSGHSFEHRQTYARHLYKISRRHRLRLSNETKEVLCRKCSTLLAQGSTSRVRLRNGMKIRHCLHCGNVRRTPYKFKQEASV
ncbi:MAG: hypothetical protein CMA97_06555 [Euryarchaeota archaeon]|nr:hypothetical protein [Euryarchaeota archaeon]